MSKFKIGDRVTVAPMDEDEAHEGVMDGVVTKIQEDYPNDPEVYYLVELDEPPASMNHLEPPYNIDAAEWELTSLDPIQNMGENA